MGHTDVSLSRVILVSVPLMPLQCAAQCSLFPTTTFPLKISPLQLLCDSSHLSPNPNYPPLHPPVLCAREKATCDICSRCDL